MFRFIKYHPSDNTQKCYWIESSYNKNATQVPTSFTVYWRFDQVKSPCIYTYQYQGNSSKHLTSNIKGGYQQPMATPMGPTSTPNRVTPLAPKANPYEPKFKQGFLDEVVNNEVIQVGGKSSIVISQWNYIIKILHTVWWISSTCAMHRHHNTSALYIGSTYSNRVTSYMEMFKSSWSYYMNIKTKMRDEKLKNHTHWSVLNQKDAISSCISSLEK